MLPVGATRFVALSCSLCGYTEFFNLAVVVHEEEPALGQAELRQGMENA
jgi:predicted nucleic-acid-binding Zn-ribbon protein